MAQQIELHRHLDVSLRLGTLLELAQERGLESQSTSLDAFREKVVLRSPHRDLADVLARFSLLQMVLDHPSVLERVAYETVHDCHREGTRAVELRFGPGFVSEVSRLKWEDVLDGFETGMKRALAELPGMRAGLICIGVRDYGTEHIEEVAEFFLRHPDRFIGFDLAGNESGFPCRLYDRPLRKLRDFGTRITVHAGEATGPENIWEAIELLGAERIGHGVTSIGDPELMSVLRERGICLEICPTSNWLTQAVENLKDHPLPRLLQQGVPVSINTDDPTVFGVTLSDEISTCKTKLGMSEADIQRCFAHAEKASFLGS